MCERVCEGARLEASAKYPKGGVKPDRPPATSGCCLRLSASQENTIKNQVLVSFCQKDILETTALEKKYDVVVSNPPYVRQLEKKAMSANVLDYEPGGALFVPNEDPLLFYRKIAQLALVSLQEKGWLYFEINEYLSNEMDALLNEIGFVNIEIKKDFRAVPRMIKCQKL